MLNFMDNQGKLLSLLSERTESAESKSGIGGFYKNLGSIERAGRTTQNTKKRGRREGVGHRTKRNREGVTGPSPREKFQPKS